MKDKLLRDTENYLHADAIAKCQLQTTVIGENVQSPAPQPNNDDDY